MRKSEINFSVELDEHNIPERIYWDATENPMKDFTIPKQLPLPYGIIIIKEL